jgi:hypothetical protein
LQGAGEGTECALIGHWPSLAAPIHGRIEPSQPELQIAGTGLLLIRQTR